jgi:hypothetical protein
VKIILGAVAVLILMIGAPNVFAKSDYISGYIHGATDAKDDCADRCHWYILEPGKGFAHHTWEFVKGYVNGFCSVTPGTSSDDDSASWDCNEGPSSASWVTG